MEDARGITQYRRGIPAFGEWNYDHGADDGGDYDWSVLTQRFESATTQIPFPVHKPCRKRSRADRRRRVPAFGEWNNNHSNGDGERGWTAAVSQYYFEPAVTMHKSLRQVGMRDDSGVVAMGKELQHKARQSWVANSGSPVGTEPFSFTVVDAVDDDLYEVPPEMLCSKSMRRKGRTWLRNLLTRCFGLNCFA